MFAFVSIFPVIVGFAFLIRRRREQDILSLCELNEVCGVHSFDLNGIKNKNLVIDESTEFGTSGEVILFRGCGENINNNLNSILAGYRGWFDIYYKIEKGQYIKWGRGKRVNNYEARIRDGKIKYIFPIKYTNDLYTPKIFL
jgi:hypothetical protein